MGNCCSPGSGAVQTSKPLEEVLNLTVLTEELKLLIESLRTKLKNQNVFYEASLLYFDSMYSIVLKGESKPKSDKIIPLANNLKEFHQGLLNETDLELLKDVLRNCHKKLKELYLQITGVRIIFPKILDIKTLDQLGNNTINQADFANGFDNLSMKLESLKNDLNTSSLKIDCILAAQLWQGYFKEKISVDWATFEPFCLIFLQQLALKHLNSKQITLLKNELTINDEVTPQTLDIFFKNHWVSSIFRTNFLSQAEKIE